MKEVAEVDPEELAKILEIEKEKASEIVDVALQLVRKEEGPEVREEAAPGPTDPGLDPLDRIEGVGEKTAKILEANGFKRVQDILKTTVEKLSELPGIGSKRAEKLIRSAQRYVEGRGNG